MIIFFSSNRKRSGEGIWVVKEKIASDAVKFGSPVICLTLVFSSPPPENFCSQRYFRWWGFHPCKPTFSSVSLLIYWTRCNCPFLGGDVPLLWTFLDPVFVFSQHISLQFFVTSYLSVSCVFQECLVQTLPSCLISSPLSISPPYFLAFVYFLYSLWCFFFKQSN